LVDRDYITVQGDSPGTYTGTVLTMADNVNVNMFNLSDATFFTLRNIQLQGNRANNNAGSGIWSATGGGILPTADLRIEHTFIRSFATDGVYLLDCWGTVITGSYLEANGRNGAFLGSHNYLIESSTFNWNREYGIRMGGAEASTVRGCSISENAKHGVYVSGGHGNIIVGNIIKGNGWNTSNTYDGINVLGGGQNTTITANLISGRGQHDYDDAVYSRYGIYCAAEETTIVGNSLLECGTDEIHAAVADVILEANYGYITENAGSATAQHADWVAHGIAESPTYIGLSVQNSSARFFITCIDRNATHFRIGLWDTGESSVTVDQTIRWYVEYQP